MQAYPVELPFLDADWLGVVGETSATVSMSSGRGSEPLPPPPPTRLAFFGLGRRNDGMLAGGGNGSVSTSAGSGSGGGTSSASGMAEEVGSTPAATGRHILTLPLIAGPTAAAESVELSS